MYAIRSYYEFSLAPHAAGGGAASVDELFARYRVINHGIWVELERGEIDKESLKAERFRRLFAEFGIGADPAAFSARFLVLLSEGAQVLPGALDFVRVITSYSIHYTKLYEKKSSVPAGHV